MLPQIYQGVMSSWNILKILFKEEELVKYSNGLTPLSSQPKINKIKDYHAKKREASREEAPVAFTQKLQVNQPPQEGKKNKKKNWSKPYFSSYRITKIQKEPMGNCLNIAIILMEFKEKEEQRMRQAHFPKRQLCLLML
ncbi:hypothetical protein O181_024453 [Austropuccinia psidii MF-1]|uniref:Uncharacterized protein n=1 Tax=Austropuccinia psidii MF-1 TaxID=1389203 RepID=A0A9Q3CKU0_9BASI|nr:hypothetical protein [Austropuccinia psidii MF-1]